MVSILCRDKRSKRITKVQHIHGIMVAQLKPVDVITRNIGYFGVYRTGGLVIAETVDVIVLKKIPEWIIFLVSRKIRIFLRCQQRTPCQCVKTHRQRLRMVSPLHRERHLLIVSGSRPFSGDIVYP